MKTSILFIIALALSFAVGYNCKNTTQILQEEKDKELFEQIPQPQERKSEELFKAVKNNDVKKAKELLERGDEPNAIEQVYFENSDGEMKKTEFFATPLGKAVDNKSVEIARLLLEYGANVDKHYVTLNKDSQEDRIFLNFVKAVVNQDVSMMKLLINHHANLNNDDDDTTSPLIIEAKKKEVLDLLIESGFDINTQDKVTGDTCLIRAVVLQNLNLVKAILRYKPNLSLKLKPVNAGFNYEEFTALQIAKLHGNKKIIEALKKAGAKK